MKLTRLGLMSLRARACWCGAKVGELCRQVSASGPPHLDMRGGDGLVGWPHGVHNMRVTDECTTELAATLSAAELTEQAPELMLAALKAAP